MSREVYTLKAAADILGVAIDTVRQWCLSGRLKARREGDGGKGSRWIITIPDDGGVELRRRKKKVTRDIAPGGATDADLRTGEIARSHAPTGAAMTTHHLHEEVQRLERVVADRDAVITERDKTILALCFRLQRFLDRIL
jgi:hypothetical protein